MRMEILATVDQFCFVLPVKAYNKTKQVLEILESARPRRRKMFADCVAANCVAETIAKIKPASEPQIDSDVCAESWTGRGELDRRQDGSAS